MLLEIAEGCQSSSGTIGEIRRMILNAKIGYFSENNKIFE
jgi:hypothetical protein